MLCSPMHRKAVRNVRNVLSIFHQFYYFNKRRYITETVKNKKEEEGQKAPNKRTDNITPEPRTSRRKD